jgi:acyl carrier protein
MLLYSLIMTCKANHTEPFAYFDAMLKRFSYEISYIAPITKTEEKLIEILKGLLQLDKVSTHAHFFDIGGDSLSAVPYKFKIDKELFIDLPLSSLFECPTIEGLAKHIDAKCESSLS